MPLSVFPSANSPPHARSNDIIYLRGRCDDAGAHVRKYCRQIQHRPATVPDVSNDSSQRVAICDCRTWASHRYCRCSRKQPRPVSSRLKTCEKLVPRRNQFILWNQCFSLVFFSFQILTFHCIYVMGIYVYDRIADDRIRLEKSNDRMGTKW